MLLIIAVFIAIGLLSWVRMITPSHKQGKAEKYSDALPKMDYQDKDKPYLRTIQWGQRKLFLMELRFLLECHKNKVPMKTIIYVGAASGTHIPHLIRTVETFAPGLVWHLYDINPFCPELKTTSAVLFDEYFTVETCARYKDAGLIFISDLRIFDPDATNQQDRIDDLQLQKDLHLALRPAATSIKFALPYPESSLPDEFEYLDGDVWFQPYAPQNSTETRLIIFGTTKTKKYSCSTYEKVCVYYNRVVRPKISPNDYPDIFPSMDQDAVYEVKIWSLFDKEHIKEQILALNTALQSDFATAYERAHTRHRRKNLLADQ